jgi:pectate lyase
MNAIGQNGTTGGANGQVVTTVTDAERLSFYASREGPYVIQVKGEIAATSISIHDNKTVVGIGERPTIRGQLYVNGHKNVIIRNLYVTSAEGDCISIINKAHHVWVDHCDLSDSTDGLLDITRESDYVTVSWCRFHYSQPTGNHRLVCLIGSSDRQTADANCLHVTMHHNWWAENCVERMPSVRYGRVHLFNNYYTCSGNNYCVLSRLGAQVLVENCYFRQVNNPHGIRVSRTEQRLNIPKGMLKASGNLYDQTSGLTEQNGAVFSPPYEWRLDRAEDVPSIVAAGAGPFPDKEVKE